MLALILLGTAVVLALVIVVAWLVHSVSKLKTEAAYVSELNKIIDHVNSLSHGVQQAHVRSTTRLEQTEGVATTANAKGAAAEVKVTELTGKITAIDTNLAQTKQTADAAKLKADQLGTSLTKVPTFDHLSTNYLLKADIPDPSEEGFAKWDEFETRDLATRTISAQSLSLTSAQNAKGTLKIDDVNGLVYCAQSDQCKKVQTV